tara:strand:- start:863 stop:1588 length:726 start_codon:yes stop_codon:yes gene_type:complete
MEGEQIDVKEIGFINHVFKYDNDTKNTLMNLLQYTIIALIPITLINNTIDSLNPNVDETKGNLELLAEIILHYGILLISIILIHRVIVYIPTYSGRAYPDLNIFNFIILFLITTYHSKNKTSDKIKVLVNRLNDIWNGKEKVDNDNTKKPAVKVSQPISGLRQPTHQNSRSDLLMSQKQINNPTLSIGSTEQIPNNNINNIGGGVATSDNIYNNGGFGGLQDANLPVEPMAANSFSGFTGW